MSTTAGMAGAERRQQSQGFLYLDTSALVKLLVRESESEAIEVELLCWSKLATSLVSNVELPRAVSRAREERPNSVVDGSLVLRGILASTTTIALDERIVGKARDVKPTSVGALDAIHVASALSLGPDLTAVATYDKRMQEALALVNVEVLAPGPT
ncbi:MAG: type II toxin-antitoxin system VapC family toxin [Solirubrobacteraceae bacterium]